MKSKAGKNRQDRDELAMKVASLYYAFDKAGKHRMAKKEIGEKLTLNEHRVSNLIRYAHRKGYVTYRINRDKVAQDQLERIDENLSWNMAETFPNLYRAIVVNMPPEVENESDRLEKSNRIHRHLGRAMAWHLLQIIRDGDHIGFGSGRGVCDTCINLTSFFKKLKLPRFKWIRLTSLTGCALVTKWSAQKSVVETYLDADNAVNEFKAICDGPSANLAGSNIAITKDKIIDEETEDKKDLYSFKDSDDYLYEHMPAISLKTWKKDFPRNPQFVPDWCLLGAGHLVEGHRFLRKDIRPELRPELNPIEPELNQLKKLFKDGKDERDNNPVGDICNRLFVIRSEKDILNEKREIEDQIEDVVKTINKYLACITDEHLALVGKIFLVAGGNHKAKVIQTILHRKFLKRTRLTLCTDTECAKLILELEGEKQKSP